MCVYADCLYKRGCTVLDAKCCKCQHLKCVAAYALCKVSYYYNLLFVTIRHSQVPTYTGSLSFHRRFASFHMIVIHAVVAKKIILILIFFLLLLLLLLLSLFLFLFSSIRWQQALTIHCPAALRVDSEDFF